MPLGDPSSAGAGAPPPGGPSGQAWRSARPLHSHDVPTASPAQRLAQAAPGRHPVPRPPPETLLPQPTDATQSRPAGLGACPSRI